MRTLLRSLAVPAFLATLAVASQAQVASDPTRIPRPAHGATPNLKRGWPGYGRDAAHNAQAPVPAQSLQQIHWSTPVDLDPQYWGDILLIHYGSPLVTQLGTVVVTVKTGATDGFQLEGHDRHDGSLRWTQTTDYILPPHDWTPSMGSTLTPANELAIPGAGGTIYIREKPDGAVSPVRHLAFYGLASYLANQATYDANVLIDTPITSDAHGNLYFGFLVQGATPAGLASGIARISSTGVGTWVAASTAAGDGAIQKVVYNAAPAIGLDGQSLYVAVNDVAGSGFGAGYLLKLDSQTLGLIAKVRLKDAGTPANDAYLPDDGTASPCVGPDGDVYFGVLENPFPDNHARGWMLHFNGSLSMTKLPGAFGWDDTASIVPVAAVPGYAGSSSYLLLTKYNNYAFDGGGDGVNKVAVVDPGVPMIDPISGVTVMNEVLTIAGPTPDLDHIAEFPNAVREWCINTAVVDVAGQCALVNNEDGKLYRWDFATNTLSESMTVTSGIGEAYTATIVGSDGTVYATNNAVLFAVGD